MRLTDLNDVKNALGNYVVRKCDGQIDEEGLLYLHSLIDMAYFIGQSDLNQKLNEDLESMKSEIL